MVGICDSALFERLQLNSELTLEKAKKLVRQKEAVHEHQQFLTSKSREGAVVDAVTKTNSKQRSCRGRQNRSFTRPPTQQSQPTNQQVCTRCGKGVHSRNTYLAKEAICHKCNKKGHYSAVCHTKAVATVSGEPLETAYLDTIERDSSSHQPWICHINVNNIPTAFKIDTGAEVTAISEETFCLLNSELNKPSKALQGPDRKPLSALGSVTVSLKHEDRHTTQEVFIIKGLNHNLLGLPAIEALQLGAMVHSVQDETALVKEKFPLLFNGLGSISTEYTIQLKPNATSYALSTVRNVPIPLRDKVKAELQRMLDLGVISKVDYPTPWYICWHGGGTQEDRRGTHICQPKVIEC